MIELLILLFTVGISSRDKSEKSNDNVERELERSNSSDMCPYHLPAMDNMHQFKPPVAFDNFKSGYDANRQVHWTLRERLKVVED